MVWTRQLSCPQRSAIAAKPAAIDSASAMSTLIPTASGAPASRSDVTAASRASRPRAITATLAPSAARVSAMASPIPLLPPVTTAVDPSKPRSMVISLSRLESHAQPAQDEMQNALPKLVAVTFARRPLPVDADPHHAMDELGAGDRLDVAKHPAAQSALQRLDERCEHLCVCGLNQAGGGERLRLSLQRQAPQIGSDVLVECQIEASVDPRRYRLDLRCGSGHSASESPLLDARGLQKHGGNQFVLGFEMPIERPGAQSRSFQDPGNAEPANTP